MKMPLSSCFVTVVIALVISLLFTVKDYSYLPLLQLAQNIASDADFHLIANPNPTSRQDLNDDQQWSTLFNDPIINPQHQKENNFTYIPFINLTKAQQWLETEPLVRGISPRWILPGQFLTGSQTTSDGYIFVYNQEKERNIGLGHRSPYFRLQSMEIAISEGTAVLLQKQAGQQLEMTFSLQDLLNQRNLLNKFYDIRSSQDITEEIDPPELDLENFINNNLLDQISTLNLSQASKILLEKNLEDIRDELVYGEFKATFKIKSILNSSYGIWPNQLRNVAVVDQRSLLPLLKQLVKNFRLSLSQRIGAFQLRYLSLEGALDDYEQDILNYPPLAAVCLWNKTTLYHPTRELRTLLAPILVNMPSEYEALPFSPLFYMLSRLCLFFNSIVQIYIFLLSIIYVQLIWSIIDTHYRRCSNDIRLYRMVGYGAHPGAGLLPYRFLGAWHWLITLIISLVVMVVARLLTVYFALHYYSLQFEWPTMYIVGVIVVGLALGIASGLYYGLGGIWFGIPKGNSFAAPKVKVERIDKLGLQTIWILSGVMLLFYGLVAFIMIPQAAINLKDQLSTFLFNLIFFLLYIGIITIFNLIQTPVEIMIGHLVTLLPFLRPLSSIIYSNQRSKKFNYKYITLAFSLVFAFLIFFTNGINMQLDLISSLVKRSLGSELIFQKISGQMFDRHEIDPILAHLKQQQYLQEYTWQSVNLNTMKQFTKNSLLIKNTVFGEQKVVPLVYDVNFFKATFDQYYIPQKYLGPSSQYERLSHGARNGFEEIYYPNGTSKGAYHQAQAVNQTDEFNVISFNHSQKMDHQQVINVIAGTSLLIDTGMAVGQTFIFENSRCRFRGLVRHEVQIMPGYDIDMGSKIMISREQAQHILQSCQIPGEEVSQLKWDKLFIKVEKQKLETVISAISKKSPSHVIIATTIELDQTLDSIQTVLTVILVITSTICILILAFMLAHSMYSKLIIQPQPHFLLRAIGLKSVQTAYYFLTELYIELGVGVGIGITIGTVNSLTWAAMASALMHVNLEVKMGMLLILGFVGIVAVLGWISVRVATGWMQNSSIAFNVK